MGSIPTPGTGLWAVFHIRPRGGRRFPIHASGATPVPPALKTATSSPRSLHPVTKNFLQKHHVASRLYVPGWHRRPLVRVLGWVRFAACTCLI